MAPISEAPAATPSCRLVRAGQAFQGKQGLMYAPAISAETVGSQAIHMQLLTIPPGGRAKAHKHAAHESAIYLLSGVGCMWYGHQLEHHYQLEPGIFSTSQPTCLTCPTTRARRKTPSPSSPAPTPTSRRASSCCPTSTPSTRQTLLDARNTDVHEPQSLHFG